jgi:hypothetical protein
VPTTYNWPLQQPSSGSTPPTPSSTALSLTAIETAIEAWIVAATGLPVAQVFNVNAKKPQPAAPYVEVRIGGLVTVAQDEVRRSFHADFTAGNELELQVVGRREFAASLQAHTQDPTAADGGAVALLSKCKTALRLPSRRDAFNAAGLSVIESLQILDLSSRTPGGTGRASMDVRFNCTDSASDFTGYITTVGLAPLNTP